ncbi:MAG: VPLPA-CTERM sorting domain-containing protein [Gammaproteobacteria bacterium]
MDTATVVPLPATVWFLATGLAGLALRSRQRAG